LSPYKGGHEGQGRLLVADVRVGPVKTLPEPAGGRGEQLRRRVDHGGQPEGRQKDDGRSDAHERPRQLPRRPD